MPTVTTTVTSAQASGVTTTVTSTESTPGPVPTSTRGEDSAFAVEEGGLVKNAGEGQRVYEFEIAPNVWQFQVMLQFPSADFLPWLSGPITADGDKLRKIVLDQRGELAAFQFDKDVKRFLKLCDAEGNATEEFKAMSKDELINYGCSVPVSMTVFKIVATGELACYSVLDPSLKMHGSDKTLKERLAELGAKRPFMLPACMHHGDFIKPFKENFPDAQLVLTSGFTCPQASAASNMDCVRGLAVDFVIPANRERRWKAKSGGAVARDDTAALKAALNDEIDFSHQLEMHSEEVCFIHRASKVLVTADVWYTCWPSQYAGMPFPGFDPLANTMELEFGDQNMAWRLWITAHMKTSPNGLMADYWWGIEGDLKGFCEATGMVQAQWHMEEDSTTMMREGWESVKELAAMDEWQISIPSHSKALYDRKAAGKSLLANWAWLGDCKPLPFGSEFPPQAVPAEYL